jgi:uncharacterized oxidoreductase
MLVSHTELRQVATNVLTTSGATPADADVVGNHLVDANLAGHDSHGVIRIPQYVDEMQQGSIRSGVDCQTISDRPTSACLDAHQMFGQVAADHAMNLAITKAREAGGIGLVTMQRANHTGRLGHFVTKAAEKNMIGLVAVNAGGGGQWVAPFGGIGKRLSTNPLAIGAPTNGDFPLILDISTCVVPEGKIRHHLQSRQPVPLGWLNDSDGIPTDNPAALYESLNSAIQPLGGIAAHKGFGLSFMVDVLAGALSGAGCARAGVDPKDPIGHGVLFLAIDIAQLTPIAAFLENVEALISHIHDSPPAPGFDEVLVPGEFEYRKRIERLEKGIEIPAETWDSISSLAQ